MVLASTTIRLLILEKVPILPPQTIFVLDYGTAKLLSPEKEFEILIIQSGKSNFLVNSIKTFFHTCLIYSFIEAHLACNYKCVKLLSHGCDFIHWGISPRRWRGSLFDFSFHREHGLHRDWYSWYGGDRCCWQAHCWGSLGCFRSCRLWRSFWCVSCENIKLVVIIRIRLWPSVTKII